MTIEMTQKEMYAYIAEQLSEDTAVVEFCERKLAQLSRPRKSSTKPETVELRQAVATALADKEEPVFARDLAEEVGSSTSAVAAALRFLVAEGIAEKVESAKRKDPAMYQVVVTEG